MDNWDDGLVLPDTGYFTHRPARSAGGKSHGAPPAHMRAMKRVSGAPSRPVHEVVRVAQDKTIILIAHQILLDARRPLSSQNLLRNTLLCRLSYSAVPLEKPVDAINKVAWD